MTGIYEKLLKSDFILKVKNFFLASEYQPRLMAILLKATSSFYTMEMD